MPVQNLVPLTTDLACIFGAYLASKGKSRVGIAMIVQQATGLRPSELLALQTDHIYVPPDCIQPLTIRLGAVVSTKVKREQFVLLAPCKQPLATALLRKLHADTVVGSRLFPSGYSVYNNSFKLCETHYQLNLGMTAHSPRAGFATSQVIAGVPVKEIQAAGRWLCEASFQTYVDVVAAAHIKAQVGSKALDDTVRWVQSRLHLYFDLLDPDVGKITSSKAVRDMLPDPPENMSTHQSRQWRAEKWEEIWGGGPTKGLGKSTDRPPPLPRARAAASSFGGVLKPKRWISNRISWGCKQLCAGPVFCLLLIGVASLGGSQGFLAQQH